MFGFKNMLSALLLKNPSCVVKLCVQQFYPQVNGIQKEFKYIFGTLVATSIMSTVISSYMFVRVTTMKIYYRRKFNFGETDLKREPNFFIF